MKRTLVRLVKNLTLRLVQHKIFLFFAEVPHLKVSGMPMCRYVEKNPQNLQTVAFALQDIYERNVVFFLI